MCAAQVRLEPLGVDNAQCNILHVSDSDVRVFRCCTLFADHCRLTSIFLGREHRRAVKRGKKEPAAPKWETLSTNLEELEELADKWRNSRGRLQKDRKLAQAIDGFLPVLQAKERQKKRDSAIALLPRRRSDRAVIMERKELEKSMAEERRELELELHRAEQARKREEEEKRRERELREAEAAAVAAQSEEDEEKERAQREEREERMLRREMGLPAMLLEPEFELEPEPVPEPMAQEQQEFRRSSRERPPPMEEIRQSEERRLAQQQEREAHKRRQQQLHVQMEAERIAQQEADDAAAKHRADRMARRSQGLPAEHMLAPVAPATLREEREDRANAHAQASRKPRAGGGKRVQSLVLGEVDESIKCPCGVPRDNGSLMISCEACEAWMHASCVGFDSAQEVPENFRCRVCRLCGRQAAVQPEAVNGGIASGRSSRVRTPSSRLISYVEQSSQARVVEKATPVRGGSARGAKRPHARSTYRHEQPATAPVVETDLWVQCDKCCQWLRANEVCDEPALSV